MTCFYKSLSEARFPFLAKTGSEKVILAGTRGYFAKNKVPGFFTFCFGLMKYFRLASIWEGLFTMLFRKWETLKHDSNYNVS